MSSVQEQMGEVVGIMLNQVFDMVSMSAMRDALSLSVGVFCNTRNSQNPSRYQAMSQHRSTNGMDSINIPYYAFKYAVLRSFFQLEFENRLFGANSSVYLSDK